MRKLLIALVLAAVAAGAIAFYKLRSTPRYRVTPVRRGTIEAVVEAPGRLVPLRELAVVAEVDGRVVEVAVEPGQHVEAGRLLVRLQNRELQSRLRRAQLQLEMARLELAQAQKGPSPDELKAVEAELAAAQARLAALKKGPSPAELAAARAEVEKAEAALKLAQAEYDKIAWMPQAAMMPQALALQQATLDYEAAKARYDALLEEPSPEELEAAAKEVEAARARLERLRKGPSEEELELLREKVALAEEDVTAAREALDAVTVRAPWPGLVLGVPVTEGQLVGPGTPLVRLADVSRWRVEAEIDELDVGKVSPGQEARITFDAFPGREFEGRIRKIEPAPAEIRGSVIYKAIVDFTPGDLPVRVGLSANVGIVAGRKEGVLLIPLEAVRDVAGGKAVRVLHEGKVEYRRVTLGLSDGRRVEVLEGLREGELIVLD